MRAGLARRAASALLVSAMAVLAVGCGTSGGGGNATVTYYVSPSGNDAAAGTSPGTAWRSLAKASSLTLPPGTRLLLQGGQVFNGELKVGPRDAGSASDPVVIGSYGSGAARIVSGTGYGIAVYDTAGVDIQDLNLTSDASGPPAGNGAGISVYSDRPAGHRLDHIVISDVDVSGFVNGISVGGTHDGAGFSDVTVSDADLHDNIDAGLDTFGPAFNPRSPAYTNRDVTVSHVTASQNRGNPADTSENTGNGIVLGSVDGGTVSGSTAAGNGGLGAAAAGPEGIWTYDSTGVDIEHNLSYGNQTANQVDGNGFGLDQNTSDSVLEYNLSYGNAGTGYMVYSGLDDGSEKDNTVRYNISSGDGRDGTKFYGGIAVIGWVRDVAVYQNTVVMGPTGPAGTPPVLWLGPGVRGVVVRNNIFSTQSGPIVLASSALAPSAVLLQGNDYYSDGGPWLVVWGQAAYGSLSQWRAATGQETVGSQPTGFAVDPQMAGQVLGLSVQSAAAAAGAAAGFELKPGSPLIGAGLDLGSLGMRPPATNFAGRAQSAQHPNIGAL